VDDAALLGWPRRRRGRLGAVRILGADDLLRGPQAVELGVDARVVGVRGEGLRQVLEEVGAQLLAPGRAKWALTASNRAR
jgi:hypothetical protein